MTSDTPIRRDPDGAIDTAHYIQRGRRLQQDALRGAIRSAVSALWRWLLRSEPRLPRAGQKSRPLRSGSP